LRFIGEFETDGFFLLITIGFELLPFDVRGA
jgi:hypothetical protein